MGVPGLPITPADNAMGLCNQSKLGPKLSPGLLDIEVTAPKGLLPEKPGGDICLTYSSPRTTSYARATQSYETAEPTDQISQTAPESSGSGDGNYPAQGGEGKEGGEGKRGREGTVTASC